MKKKRSLIVLLGILAAQANSVAIPYPVVDTGQRHCYDDQNAISFPKVGNEFYGQDAQYSANTPSYKVNDDGTVSDLVTDLMWQQDPGEKKTFDEAVADASKCQTGNYTDWRLPTIKELYSLIQLNGTDPDPNNDDPSDLKPFIDDSVFKFTYGKEEDGDRIIDSQYASNTKYVSTTMGGNETLFGVNFADGRIKGYPIADRRRGGNKTFYVLYVRGNTGYGINQFKDNKDGTLTDEATGLTWMKEDSGKGMDWPTALEYAENLKLAGHDDWRLPSAKELQSIIDYTRSPDTTDSAAIDPIFDATAITNEGGKKDFAQYWTSTTHASSRTANAAVYFAFGRALGFMSDRSTGGKTLLDVHGAGSQRSDPKVGDASLFPEGRGPQGDVIRIDNLVRLVRGGDVEKVKAGPTIEKNQSSSRRSRTGGETQRRTEREGGPDGGFMKRADRNNDGQVSKAKFRGPSQHFARLDKNSDGFITEDEAPTGPPPGRERSSANNQPVIAPKNTPTYSMPVFEGSSDKPNIVFILADDMGWTGSSVEMIQGDPSTQSDFYQTPNLEKLAAQGIRFSQAYAPASLCTPSRAAILTGKTPAEIHITTPGGGRGTGTEKLTPPQQRNDIPAEETTLPEALKSVGYATAHLGKWHIGRGNPGSHGFDVHDGATGNNANGSETDPKEVFSLTQRGIEFMKEQVQAGRPFYLQLSHYAVHTPIQSLEESKNKFEKLPAGTRHSLTDYAGMTWDLDTSIGTLRKAIEELGIAYNTYIVFMSDNGAAAGRKTPQNTPLNKGKGTLYEGGIRVPLLIAGPRIETNGASSEAVTGCDLFPTFCEWAGVPLVGKIEGVSLVPLLTDDPSTFQRSEKAFLFHYPHYGQGPAQKPQTAIIAGNYKLIRDLETGTLQLFDPEKDISEKNDLSKQNPELTEKLEQLMDQRLKEVDAQLPTENPDYDPDAKQERTGQRRN